MIYETIDIKQEIKHFEDFCKGTFDSCTFTCLVHSITFDASCTTSL